MKSPNNDKPVLSNNLQGPRLDEQQLINALLKKIKSRISDLEEQVRIGKNFLGSSKHKDLDLLIRVESIVSLVQDKKFRKAIETDEEELESGKIDKSFIEKSPLLRSFCLWLSNSENGHYHISYFYPHIKCYYSFVSTFCKRLKQLVEFIDIVNDDQWNLLKKNKAALLIDDFFIVEKNKMDVNIYKINNLFKISKSTLLLAFHIPGCKSPCFHISTTELSQSITDDRFKIKITDKVNFIISSINLGNSKHD